MRKSRDKEPWQLLFSSGEDYDLLRLLSQEFKFSF